MKDKPKYDPIKQEVIDRLEKQPWYDIKALTWKDELILNSYYVPEKEPDKKDKKRRSKGSDHKPH